MQRNKKKLILLLIPLLIGGTVVLLRSHLKHVEDSPVMVSAPWAVTTDSVREANVSQGFPALGKVVSSTEVRIVPQISGIILNMGPRAGGMVRKGDVIVHLDTREIEADAGALKAKLASAVAVLNNNRKELQREQRLFKEGGSSASAVEQYQTRVRSGQANVHALKKQMESLAVKLSYGLIHAPISGRVSQRLAEPGDTLFPGKAIYILTAAQGGRVVVPVPLDTLTRIQAGGEVVLSMGGEQMTTRITRINPSLDALSMGSLEIDLPERPFNLPSSAPVEARVLTATATGLSVPANALRPASTGAQRTLFKVVGKAKPHVQLLPVEVKLCGKERCIVEGELHAGDYVVMAHGSVLLQLHDGDPITQTPATPVQP
ncbi:MAG: efflux RND transporter periplasmic adaptor subunit [Mariprofundaceae bacterium]|nr:efflux RND transporter periplasmic adaptor subunit [Mariprofundaceae bacterium]